MNKRKKQRNKKSGTFSFARQLIKTPEGPVGMGIYADWLEISVWAQSDCKISRQDVISSFSIGEEMRDIDAATSDSEDKVNQIWYEIKTRKLELKESYPFQLSENEEILSLLNKDKKRNSSYIFCLLTSYYGLVTLISKNISKASNLFEGLCTYVAHKYLSDKFGESGCLQFGAPRSGWEKNKRPLPKAIDELIKYIGDGVNRYPGIRVGRSTVAHAGDGGLDVVAWRKFPDKRLGYLLFFGQCATAKNYTSYLGKLREHQDFLENYLNTDLKPIFGFFLPHSLTTNDEVNKGYWEEIKRSKNIPFDRNRIALYGSDWSDSEVEKLMPIWRVRIQKENHLI